MSDDYEDVEIEITEHDGKFGFSLELAPGAPGTHCFNSGCIYDSEAQALLAGRCALLALEGDQGEH